MSKILLMKAVEVGDYGRCQSLLRQGVDVNAGDSAGWRPIHHACQRGDVAIVRLLIEAKADLTGGPTDPFRLAAIKGAVEVCEALVGAGVDPHAANEYGFTAFTHACSSGQLPTVEYLLKIGACVNFATPDGKTVLIMAAECNRVEVVKLLVEAGADTSLPHPSRDSSPLTPFQVAVKFDAVDVMEYFLTELGEDLAQRTVGGETLCQLARKDGRARQLLTSARTAQVVSDSIVEERAPGDGSVASRGMAPSPL